MKNLVVCSLLIVSAWARPQAPGYQANTPVNPLPVGGGAALGPALAPVTCGAGLVLDTYTGGCVAPQVTRNIYVYAAPETATPAPAPVSVPVPKIDYNIVFVRSPAPAASQEPIVIPPPQQRTLVYVLSKKQTGGQRVIEVPAGPASNPEVYFVNYGPGENPQLPGGVDLQSALGAAQGQLGAGPNALSAGGAAPPAGATGFVTLGDIGGVGNFGGNFAQLGGFGGVARGGEAGVVGVDQGAGAGQGAGQGTGGFGGASGFGGDAGFGAGSLGGVPLPGGAQNQG